MFKHAEPIPLGTRLIFSLGLVVFLVIGAAIAWLGAERAAAHDEALAWPVVNCHVLTSAIVEPKNYKDPNASAFRTFRYTFNVTYEYEVGGKKYQGNQPSFGYLASEDYYDSYQLLKQYPAGASASCRVDPANPTNSILSDAGGAPLSWWLVLIIPLIFAAIGGGGLLLLWLPPALIAHSFLARHMGVVFIAFFSVFPIAGVALIIFVILPDLHRSRIAENWPQATCTIDHSGVQAHPPTGRHGRITYSVAVLFEYTYAGLHYKSSRFGLENISTNDKAAYQAIVSSLPRGKETVCYINPLDPADAVLDRSFNSSEWIFGAASFMLILGGSTGLLKIWQKSRAVNSLPAAS